MIIKNCNIIFLDKIEKGSVLIKDGKIIEINPTNFSYYDIIDGKGLYLSPGFIDIHIHGIGGYDTMNGNYNAINEISKTICKYGTTSFLPTTMTMSPSDISKALTAIKTAKIKGTDGAKVLGAHLEGPFISPEAIGAQNPTFLMNPSLKNYISIVGNNGDCVVSITMAPELEGANELAEYLSSMGIICSIGHTKANYEEVIRGINHGFSHCTHLFNAMTPFTHRDPGTVGAVFNTDISAETICDGIHISYPSLQIAFKQKGLDKILMITDSMEACGLKDGNYLLGGQDVIVKNGAARLVNGTLAGSTLTLNNGVKNIYRNLDYPLYEVVKMASYNSAKFCNISHRKGQIKVGYDADLILFDENINIKLTMLEGKIVFNNLYLVC